MREESKQKEIMKEDQVTDRFDPGISPLLFFPLFPSFLFSFIVSLLLLSCLFLLFTRSRCTEKTCWWNGDGGDDGGREGDGNGDGNVRSLGCEIEESYNGC